MAESKNGNGKFLAEEDREVFSQLSDPVDREAFLNLVHNAAQMGKSAVELICENPEFTSRQTIRELCLRYYRQRGFFSRFFGKFFRRRRS